MCSSDLKPIVAARPRPTFEALVESIKGWTRARGDDRLQLWAVSSNGPALTLYRRCGFEATGATRPLAHTPGLIEAHMVAPISGGPAPGR